MAKFNPPVRETDLEIVDPRIERYLYERIPPRDAVLAEMEARAEKERIPIVGPLVGRLFELLGSSIGARRVMELGSAIGYSTIWWARTVGPDGRVWFTDGDPEKAKQARAYCERAGVASRVDFLVGDAVAKMAEVPGTFDVVFCDIDKHGYPAAFEAAKSRLRAGGLFVCDNTLWSGRVLGAFPDQDASTRGVQALNLAMAADPDFHTVILPLRDGVSVARKKS